MGYYFAVKIILFSLIKEKSAMILTLHVASTYCGSLLGYMRPISAATKAVHWLWLYNQIFSI